MTVEQKHRYIRNGLITLVLVLFAYMFTPFFTPILLAALFAFALENHVKRWTSHDIKRPWLSVGILVSLFLLVAVPVVLVILRTVTSVKKYADIGLQNTPLYVATEKLIYRATEYVNGMANKMDVDITQLTQSNNYLSRAATAVGNLATELFASLPDIVIGVFVFGMVLYYFVTQSKHLKRSIEKLDLMERNQLHELIDDIKKSSYTALIASAIIGCLQAGTLSIIAYFFGFSEFLILFVITFIFSLIPVIGAAPVAIFLALISFIQGNDGSAIAMLVTAIVVGSVDNIVKPLIINSNQEAHPVIALLSLIGAITVFGMPGLLIGPVLTDLAFKIGPLFYPSKNL